MKKILDRKKLWDDARAGTGGIYFHAHITRVYPLPLYQVRVGDAA